MGDALIVLQDRHGIKREALFLQTKFSIRLPLSLPIPDVILDFPQCLDRIRRNPCHMIRSEVLKSKSFCLFGCP